jgi:hypothetical protein
MIYLAKNPHKLETYESVNNFYPPHKTLKTLAVSGFTSLATIAYSVAVALPANAISFNLSFTTDNTNGVGPYIVNSVLTTSDISPTPTTNNTYTLTGISGTVNGNAITGLSNYFGADNLFRWDGTTNILLTFNGISFATASNAYNFYSGGGGTTSADFALSNLASYDENNTISGFNNVTISSLDPIAATPVPFDFDPSFGLLALGGAWTVRKMIKKSKSVVNK